eukprot:2833155-Karenia_brevis.AAC.1
MAGPRSWQGHVWQKSPMGAGMLNAVARGQTPGFMKCQHWHCPGNSPTIGITLDYPTFPKRDNCGRPHVE